MNMVLKVITLELVVVFMVGCLVGCGKSKYEYPDGCPAPKAKDSHIEMLDYETNGMRVFRVHDTTSDDWDAYVQSIIALKCKYNSIGYSTHTFLATTSDGKYNIDTVYYPDKNYYIMNFVPTSDIILPYVK